jgi:TrkA domain protein
MPVDLQETRLPGIGLKFTLRLDAGGRLAIILHNDGKRELYFFRRVDDDEPTAVITLDDDEARQLGAVIGGAYERPQIVEDLEMALGELQIEWIAVPDDSPWIGTIERGDTLVTVGKAGQYPAFRRLLQAGG